MESIIQVVRGDKLDIVGRTCYFCQNPATNIFGVTKDIKFDGVTLSSFAVCKDHYTKLNSLLSGKFDIDQIYLETYKHERKLQLRR